MAETSPSATGPVAGSAAPAASQFALRQELARPLAFLYGLLCIGLCLLLWWVFTRGETVEERWISPAVLPSPAETFAADTLHKLWFDRTLTRQTAASLRRVALGFGLAALVGVPLGILCGCFTPLGAFFAPLTIFGRNIPIAALIPLTFSFFGIGEFQKVMFIFIACVAFIVMDSARAIGDVNSRYIDTAYTLGASRRQIILHVLTPLAMPGIFNSLRLLFGLAFGYIMLAELVKLGDSAGGLGDIINISQRLGYQTHIILVLLIIPLVALAIDRLLFWIQRELFPHQYGGHGLLREVVRWCLHRWEDLQSLVWKPRAFAPPSYDAPLAVAATPSAAAPPAPPDVVARKSP